MGDVEETKQVKSEVPSILKRESDYHRKAPEGVFESHPEP